MAKTKAENLGTSTQLPTCASCKRDVGVEAGQVPFFVDDCASTSGEKAKHEAFCPTCFVYVRSPREPGRFPPGVFVPMKCARCGLSSVAVGSLSCMQCSSRHVVLLPPEPGVA